MAFVAYDSAASCIGLKRRFFLRRSFEINEQGQHCQA